MSERTVRDVVVGARSLARVYYEMMGCKVPAGYKFEDATHPQEKLCWEMACYAYEIFDGSDVAECVAEMIDD